ncbi:hypothetical protein JHK82_055258 [Glycine max]|nr:hypothetical protein JHK82_055258 [Glycine max]
MSKTGEKTKAMAAQLKVMKVEVKDIGIKMEKLTSKKKTIKENLASTKDMIANLKNTLENMETCQRHSKQKNQCSVSTLPRSPSEDVCQVSALFVDLAARCDSSNTVDVYRFGVLLRGEDVRGKDVRFGRQGFGITFLSLHLICFNRPCILFCGMAKVMMMSTLLRSVWRRVEHGFLGFQFSMVEWLNGRSSGVGGCGGG